MTHNKGDHTMVRVASVEPLPNYRLSLRFTDGLEGTVSLCHLIGHGVFSQLADPAEFQRVFVNPATQTVAWPNDIDICPDTLYEEAQRANRSVVPEEEAQTVKARG